MKGKILRWSYINKWGKVKHPILGTVMTYTLYDKGDGMPYIFVYTAPMVDENDNIYCYKFNPESQKWEDAIEYLGKYKGQNEIDYK